MVPKAGRKRGFTYMNMNVRVISLSGLDVMTCSSQHLFYLKSMKADFVLGFKG